MQLDLLDIDRTEYTYSKCTNEVSPLGNPHSLGKQESSPFKYESMARKNGYVTYRAEPTSGKWERASPADMP